MAKRVLIAEDSTSVRQMMEFTLSSAGFEVASAPDGKAAFEKLKTFQPNLILTDLHMPEMNGIELVRAVRSSPEFKFIPILVITNETSTERKKEARGAGATGWIVKPFNPKQLVAVE